MKKDKYQEEVDKNYEWFQKNKEKLIKENEDKIGYYVLLKNQNIVGIYKTYKEVFFTAHKKFNNEPYSVQQLLTKERQWVY
ncbi:MULTISPECIES: hypothetical protein [Spiroplasma]|uniref:hypothetical protein n=1 Tax=Spiroplasma TaxID=2132 RepID=UPI00207ACE14|nr:MULTISPECIES: hypothetical protein [Spiroplasma]